MSSTSKKSISDISETVKHLGYDIREVRDGRGSSAGSQNYTGTIFELWKEIDALFNSRKAVYGEVVSKGSCSTRLHNALKIFTSSTTSPNSDPC
ncbi:8367_t:CDS:2 [Paraglomus brasilianum]|uniref:8367_t:CDS:1 n=1 Tax=Paraglomus brasilianum TaxID=144538 RepID=A0A9N9DXC2_9GLOM|nr:8367_t:CDS:2 [Paraglomus brasilianum]